MIHFLQFFFDEPAHPWYQAAVWGNVIATIPLAIMGALAFFWHRGVVRQLHQKIEAHQAQHGDALAEHGRHLLLILDALDPGTDGGITEIHQRIERIADVIDVNTPGGLRVILDRLNQLDKQGENP